MCMIDIIHQSEMLGNDCDGDEDEWQRMINEWNLVPLFWSFHLSK